MTAESPAPRTRTTDQRGQASVLIIGFALVVAMTVVVVVDASAAFLRRQALNTLADGAALAAADAVREEQVYTTGLGAQAVLDPASAVVEAGSYLVSVGAGRRYQGLRHSVTAQGDRVVVRVSAPLDLPFQIPGVADQVRVTATAAATVAVGTG